MEELLVPTLVPRNLTVAPHSRTKDSVALVWDKVRIPGIHYEVLCDGAAAGVTEKTCFTLRGLSPGSDHRIWVRSRPPEGGWSLASNVVRVAPVLDVPDVDVRTLGAVGDGVTLDTTALQRAIDGCPAGGRVVLPRGTYLTGALFLKSQLTFHLESGARLLGSPDPADYPLMTYRWEGRETLCYASLLNTRPEGEGCLTEISITGPGTIDANGSLLRKRELAEARGKPGRAVCLRNVDGVYLHQTVIRQSPAWCVHLVYCRWVSVNGIEVHTKCDEAGKPYEGIANGDGLNPDSSEDVLIIDTLIASQDDCIAIKSGRDAEGRAVGLPSRNIRVLHCRFRGGFGVALGSEMAAGVRNVLVRDCTFEDSYSVASIKAPRGRGGIVEDVLFEDIGFRNLSTEHGDGKWFRGALYIDQFYSHDEFDLRVPEAVGPGTPLIRNIEFRNIDLETVAGNAVYLAGLPERPLEDIRLVNVSARGRFGLKAAQVLGLKLERVTVRSVEDPEMVLDLVVLAP